MACEVERAEVKAALHDFKEASDERLEAYGKLVELGGPQSGTSAGEVVAIGAAVAACASNPFSWIACGLGLAGLGVVAWDDQSDAWEDWEEAVDDFNEADQKYREEHDRYYDAVVDAYDCILHQGAKRTP